MGDWHWPKPNPKPPPPFYVELRVYNPDGTGRPNVVINLTGQPPQLTDQTGLVSFTLTHATGQVIAPVIPDGFTTTTPSYTITQPGNQNYIVGLAVAAPVYPPVTVPLTVDRTIFRADGQPWRWAFLSQFVALRAFERGQDLSALVAYTHAVGANGWRVFLQFCYLDNPPQVVPYTADRTMIRPFVDWLATQGLRVELTVLADNQSDRLNRDATWQTQRVADVLSLVAGAPNVTVELANEPSLNACDPYAIADALGLWTARPVLMSLGDYTIVGHETGFRWLDYIGDHPERKPDWPCESAKTGHFVTDGWPADANSPGFRGAPVPVVSDEPPHYGDGQETSVTNAEEGFGGFAVGMAGATFHSTEGIHAQVPVAGAVTDTALRAALTAMTFCPADACLGQYWHDGIAGGALESVGSDITIVGEVAGRVDGDTSPNVAAQPSDRYHPVPAPGWTLVSRAGSAGQLMILKRS